MVSHNKIIGHDLELKTLYFQKFFSDSEKLFETLSIFRKKAKLADQTI